MTPRRRALALVAALATAFATLVPLAAPASATAAPDRLTIGDGFSRFTSASFQAGRKSLLRGPSDGAPTVEVDSVARRVTFSVPSVSATGGVDSLELAWPLRVGSWSADFTGPDPEQTVRVVRAGQTCTFTAGTLVVSEASATPAGGVASINASIGSGSCRIGQHGGSYTSVAVRVGSPTTYAGVPQGSPARIASGALEGTVVEHSVTVTNTGESPWTVRDLVIGDLGGAPTFSVVPTESTCPGASLAPGASCTVLVRATARSYQVREHLVVTGNGAADLVVPIVLDGHAPVPQPTGAALSGRRGNALVTWDAPATQPALGYRVYDLGAGRSLVATAAPSATRVLVPGVGPRRLALVAATGLYSESADVELDQPLVTAELVASQGPYEGPVVVPLDAPGTSSPLSLGGDVRLDPSRTRWAYANGFDVQVCPVATQQCAPVPGVTHSALGGDVREVAWLPDGRLVLAAGAYEAAVLWTVGVDGAGLRRVGPIPWLGLPVATPDGTSVLMYAGLSTLKVVRIRLADGVRTSVPGTTDVDGFTQTTDGHLVLRRRVDMSVPTPSPTTYTVTRADGSGARPLALPAGDNRELVFDRSGTRIAFARYTAEYQATLWVAAADGSGAHEVSPTVGYWRNLQWSVDDAAAPVASLTVGPWTTTRPAITVGASDADDAVGSLGRECRLDAGAWVACSATWVPGTLTNGAHTAYARVTDPSGARSEVVSRAFTVESSLPTATLAAPAAVVTASSVALSWSGSDTGSGVASYDVRLRSAGIGGAFGAMTYPSTWQKLAGRSLTVSLSQGGQYCFSVRARDRAGNVGAFSAERCLSALLDDRGLVAGTGWTRGTSSSYAFGTYTSTARSAVSLTRSSVQARRIALVVRTCSTCGSVDVWHAGKYLGRVSLTSSTSLTKQVRWLPLQSVTRTGTVQIKSVGTRSVAVDGIAVQH